MTTQDWSGFITLLVYYAVGAGLLGLATYFINIPREVIRKSYHLMACASIFILIHAFENWYAAVLSAAFLCALVWIILPLAMQFRIFAKLSIARKGKIIEVLKQSVYFFGTLILLLAVIWGIFGTNMRYHVIVGVVAWGVGDAAAAIIGKKFGKRKLIGYLFDNNKTVAGSIGMAVFSFIGIFVILIIASEAGLLFVLIVSFLLAILATMMEAIAVKGLDTVIVPIVVSFSSFFFYLSELYRLSNL